MPKNKNHFISNSKYNIFNILELKDKTLTLEQC